jgi:ppGpp synthetase/RelA/SpoT-type nucleotidyltranferase
VEVTFRVKTAEAMRRKLESGWSGYPGGAPINDFIGVRIILFNLQMLGTWHNLLEAWADTAGLVLVRRHDSFDKPRAAGYRALHLDYTIGASGRGFGLPPEVPIQIQVETWLQRYHSMLSHALVYKSRNPQEEYVAALEELSERLHAVDLQPVPQGRPT